MSVTSAFQPGDFSKDKSLSGEFLLGYHCQRMAYRNTQLKQSKKINHKENNDMSSLKNKIDFAVIFSVKNANPNGDPLNGNRPRTDYDGYGEVSDVCFKRKIRDRMQDAGHTIFVQSDEKKIDGMPSLKTRAEDDKMVLAKMLQRKKTPPDTTAKMACEKWLDVRTFGQLFAFKSETKDGVSIPIRGPVTIQSAFSVEPVSVTSTQITKSVSGEGDGLKEVLTPWA